MLAEEHRGYLSYNLGGLKLSLSNSPNLLVPAPVPAPMPSPSESSSSITITIFPSPSERTRRGSTLPSVKTVHSESSGIPVGKHLQATQHSVGLGQGTKGSGKQRSEPLQEGRKQRTERPR
jgi:hypothetical protein